jgi:phosphatidylglycerol:prolipoprotein diacylglycerol transferase
MINYVHQISPIALPIYENIAIRWYGLAYLAGLLLGLLLMRAMAKRNGHLLDNEQLSDLVTWSALGVMIGGRLGYCLFYSPHVLTEFSADFPFWGALKVWEGGMSSHGGFLGVLTASFLFGRKHKISWLHINDLTVLGGTLGFFFGRIANFINGELYGRVVETPISWAVKFPQELNEWLNYSQAKLLNLEPLVQNVAGQPGVPASVTAFNWSDLVSRYSVDGSARASVQQMVGWIQDQAIQHNATVITALQSILPGRYPSQLIQAVCEGLLVFILLNLIWLKPRKPGVLTAWFGIFYAVARIIGEQFRMPDAQLGFQAMGLTRGQWLSVAMFVVGIAFLFYASKRDVPKIKGWSQT